MEFLIVFIVFFSFFLGSIFAKAKRRITRLERVIDEGKKEKEKKLSLLKRDFPKLFSLITDLDRDVQEKIIKGAVERLLLWRDFDFLLKEEERKKTLRTDPRNGVFRSTGEIKEYLPEITDDMLEEISCVMEDVVVEDDINHLLSPIDIYIDKDGQGWRVMGFTSPGTLVPFNK